MGWQYVIRYDVMTRSNLTNQKHNHSLNIILPKLYCFHKYRSQALFMIYTCTFTYIYIRTLCTLHVRLNFIYDLHEWSLIILGFSSVGRSTQSTLLSEPLKFSYHLILHQLKAHRQHGHSQNLQRCQNVVTMLSQCCHNVVAML